MHYLYKYLCDCMTCLHCHVLSCVLRQEFNLNVENPCLYIYSWDSIIIDCSVPRFFGRLASFILISLHHDSTMLLCHVFTYETDHGSLCELVPQLYILKLSLRQ